MKDRIVVFNVINHKQINHGGLSMFTQFKTEEVGHFYIYNHSNQELFKGKPKCFQPNCTNATRPYDRSGHFMTPS